MHLNHPEATPLPPQSLEAKKVHGAQKAGSCWPAGSQGGEMICPGKPDQLTQVPAVPCYSVPGHTARFMPNRRTDSPKL